MPDTGRTGRPAVAFLALMLMAAGLAFLFSAPKAPLDPGDAVAPVGLDELWNRTWDAGPGEHSQLSVIAVDASGVCVAGRTNRSDSNCDDILLSKYDASGNEVWKRSWGCDYMEEARALEMDSSGVSVGANVYDRSGGTRSVMVTRCGPDGNPSWNRTWSGPGSNYVNGIARGPAGIYLAGTRYNGTAPEEAFVLLFDMDGGIVWNRTFRGTDGYSVSCAAADSSGVYVAGQRISAGLAGVRGETDACAFKLGSGGDLLWNRTWTGPEYERATCLALSGGALYVGGDARTPLDIGGGPQPISGASRYDATLRKCDPDGRLLWNRTYVTDRSNLMLDLHASDTGVVAAGKGIDLQGGTAGDWFCLYYDGNGSLYHNTTLAAEPDLMISDMDYDPFGLYVSGGVDYRYWTSWYYPPVIMKRPLGEGTGWKHVYGGGFRDECRSASFGPGGIYACGVTDDVRRAGTDALVLKLDGDGRHLWNRTWGGDGEDESNGLAVDSSGVFVAGGENGRMSGYKDAFLLKYDFDGGLLWNRTWGGSLDDYARAVCVLESAVYVTGTTGLSSAPTESDAFLLKYDLDGRLLWARTWGDERFCYGEGVAADRSGVYVAGSISDGGSCQAFLLRYSPDGELAWERRWDVVPDLSTYVNGIACGNGIYVVGTAGGFTTRHAAFVTRFGPAGNRLWTGTWGGQADDTPCGAVADAGGVLVAGTVRESGTMGRTITLRRYQSSGELVWYGGWNANCTVEGQALAVDGSGICVLGRRDSYFSDVLAVKFDGSALPLRRPQASAADRGPLVATVLFAAAAVAAAAAVGKRR